MSFFKLVRFTGPLVGLLAYLVAFSSQHWVVTKGLHRWGLFSKCQPDSTNTAAACVYMTPEENPGYYQAVQGVATVAMLMYALLQFHFVFIKFSVLYHQLPAALSLALTAVLAVVLYLLGDNYRTDTRWTHMEPALGWSFWTGVAVGIYSLLTSATLIYGGYREHTRQKIMKTDKRSNQVCPFETSRSPVGNEGHQGDAVPGSEKGTQSSAPQTPGGSTEQPEPQKWKRRLSPIPERGHVPAVTETTEDASLQASCSAVVHACEEQ
ncbi:uncharacterized protein LOC143294288 [Babylonia areolata]|uniref:uncharacterized protein LOC143294288 n=1 Tax=Babylonia areolata TaxID=304850 RepID=UPI003FD07A55